MPHRQTGLRQTPVDPESKPRALAALIITWSLVLLVPAMVAVIGYRSIMIHGPSTAVVIGGDPSLDDARIEVTEANPPHQQWVTTLNRENNWQSPILLQPGSYHVSVTQKGKSILSEDFAPDQFSGVRFDLPSMVAIVGNSNLSNAHVEITRLSESPRVPRPTPVHFSADNHFRDCIYLFPGDYHVVVRSASGADRVLAESDFRVDRTAPVRVDLTKPVAKDDN